MNLTKTLRALRASCLYLPFAICSLLFPAAAAAQEHIPAKYEIAFNRYYRYAEMVEHLQKIAAAYPEICRLEKIGESGEGRPMYVAIVNSPKTGEDTSKPAMWIDGNVHGNEIQAGEAVLYSLWTLTKSYGHNPELTRILDTYSFYFLVSQNPDGREHWFMDIQNPSSSRSNRRPVDSDRDGLFDEDGPEDLDGDGSITQMWKEDPNGRWTRDKNDPRIFTRVEDDQKGEWSIVGEEGIDNDQDGRINEDGPGGDDMNRNWPSDWQPDYIQGGAGEFPFSNPEPAAIGAFVLAHPNIAAAQSWHNSGGMILRGPGSNYRENTYPAQDRAVYDEIGRKGEDMLPYYRYMIIYRDLYTVYGGFVNWMAEGRGAYAFTNEMFNPGMYFQRDIASPDDKRMWFFRDKMEFGQFFTPYKEFDHPQYGRVLLGGLNKWSSRVTPSFMLEEECHRNFAFVMFNADQMPVVRFGRVDVARAPGGTRDLWVVTAEVRNDKLMPTRSAWARQKGILRPDLLTCEAAGGTVVTSGRLDSWVDTRMEPVRYEPGRVQLDGGIPGRGGVIWRFYISAPAGARVLLRHRSEHASMIEKQVELKETARVP